MEYPLEFVYIGPVYSLPLRGYQGAVLGEEDGVDGPFEGVQPAEDVALDEAGNVDFPGDATRNCNLAGGPDRCDLLLVELASCSLDNLTCFGSDDSELVFTGSDDLFSAVGEYQIGGRLVEVIGGI